MRMRISVMHREGEKVVQLEADVIRIGPDVIELYHYADFYLGGKRGPFRTLKTSDYFVIATGKE